MLVVEPILGTPYSPENKHRPGLFIPFFTIYTDSNDWRKDSNMYTWFQYALKRIPREQ